MTMMASTASTTHQDSLATLFMQLLLARKLCNRYARPALCGVDGRPGLQDTLACSPEGSVSTPFVQPGARVLWCLRRRSSDVRCVLYAEGLPVEVRILQDHDVVLAELFPEERLAVTWAKVYGERLRQQGWLEAPPDVRA